MLSVNHCGDAIAHMASFKRKASRNDNDWYDPWLLVLELEGFKNSRYSTSMYQFHSLLPNTCTYGTVPEDSDLRYLTSKKPRSNPCSPLHGIGVGGNKPVRGPDTHLHTSKTLIDGLCGSEGQTPVRETSGGDSFPPISTHRDPSSSYERSDHDIDLLCLQSAEDRYMMVPISRIQNVEGPVDFNTA